MPEIGKFHTGSVIKAPGPKDPKDKSARRVEYIYVRVGSLNEFTLHQCKTESKGRSEISDWLKTRAEFEERYDRAVSVALSEAAAAIPGAAFPHQVIVSQNMGFTYAARIWREPSKHGEQIHGWRLAEDE